MSNKKSEQNNAFTKLTNLKELIAYLDNSSYRLKDSNYVYHYTRFDNLVKMLCGQYWHLANARDMNDMLEYKNGDPLRWNNLFFASFMSNAKESIGMWSMYAQPWEKGVKIALHKEILKRWINNCTEIYEVSPTNYELTGRKIIPQNPNSIRLSSVVYSNVASLENSNENESLSWGSQSNSNIVGVANNPELTGYIKDSAWDYEKEIRLKAEFENTEDFKRVAIPIPDEVIDAMIITAGPLFEGDLLKKIQSETGRTVKTNKSLFSGKLNIKTICENCEHKKKGA